MSANTSLIGALQHPHQSFIDDIVEMNCYFSNPSSYIFSTFYITNNLLLLPLCIFVLIHGLQKGWRICSTSSAETMSHSEIFTYHLVLIEMIGSLRCIMYCCGIYTGELTLISAGNSLSTFTWSGETFFHILTCVERYMAVVHPITYMSLRNERGIRIRNISTGFVWLNSFVGMGLLRMKAVFFYIYITVLILSLAITSFCSVSVLFVLIRPGPGEQGGKRERVDQSKQRAFYTIVAILGVLVVRFAGSLVWGICSQFEVNNNCLFIVGAIWLNIPSSLVLLLLYLYRAKKILCRTSNIQ